MIKRIFALLIVFNLTSCAELQQVVESLPQSGNVLSNADIASGLRQALDLGIDKQVTKLTQKDGFFKNDLVKILLPEELQKVDKALRKIGLGSLADEGLKVLNRAAEDAVKEATPIFVNAVKDITFDDAKNILLGEDNAATNYLTSKTQTALYNKFKPVIDNSFSKVGADKIWTNLITKYNNIPLTNNVNPDLTDYVTNEALEGVYTMIAIEEKEIRNKVSSRTTDLLKKVFALQD
jgi:ribosomal protein S17E